MSQGILTVDLDAIIENWRILDRRSADHVETGAVVKADSYGLGANRSAGALAQAGVRSFFVATATEGVALRKTLGPGPVIYVLSGHVGQETAQILNHDLVPLLSSVDQITRHLSALPDLRFGVQLDVGMARLGIGLSDWEQIGGRVLAAQPLLMMAQMSCSDEPDHANNEAELARFLNLTRGFAGKRSLAASAGIFLGPRFHFDLTRPGIGLYGGSINPEARRVIALDLPVLQIRDIPAGASVGYGATWQAKRPTRLATLAAGYADGLFRTLSSNVMVWSHGMACPVVGRVSMDLITVDITDLPETPQVMGLIGPSQSVADVASRAGTIEYEILTSLGRRYERRFVGGGA